MKFITLSATPDADEVRVDQLYGRTHLVAPVVMVREGVLKGGYVPGDEIAYSENGWNGRPITAPPEDGTNARAAMPDDLPDGMSGHPLDDEGDFVSANQDPYADDMRIGEVRNVETVDDNAALRAEAWLDIERVKTVGTHAQSVVESLVNGDPLDVSIGFWHDIEQSAGTFNENEYEFVVRNIMPDHLAMLPNETGACSWEDGCGVPRAATATALADIEAVADVDCQSRASMLGANQDPPDDDLEQDALSFFQRLATKFGWTDPQHQTKPMQPDIDIEALSAETGIEPDTLDDMSEDELTSLNERVIEADADDGGTDDGSTDDGGDGGQDPPEYVEQFSDRLDAIEEQLQEQQKADLSDEVERIVESTDYDEETVEGWPEEAIKATASQLQQDAFTMGGGAGVNRVAQPGASTEQEDTDDIGPVGAMTAMQAKEGGD